MFIVVSRLSSFVVVCVFVVVGCNVLLLVFVRAARCSLFVCCFLLFVRVRCSMLFVVCCCGYLVVVVVRWWLFVVAVCWLLCVVCC